MSDTFENKIKRIEEIVVKLESGECSLDESLKLYTEGVKLSAACQKTLNNAKQKIENLSDYTEQTENE